MTRTRGRRLLSCLAGGAAVLPAVLASASPAAGQCNGTSPGPPQSLTTGPPASLLATLGVLRRPATPTDVLPTGDSASTLLDFVGIQTAYVRLLATTTAHDRFYLVPGMVSHVEEAQCAPDLTPAQREALRQPRSAVATVEIGADGRDEGGGSLPPAAIAAGTFVQGGVASSQSASSLPGHRTKYGKEHVTATIDGLVPDGVAAVALVYRRRPVRTLAVTDNFFALTVHRDLAVHGSSAPNPPADLTAPIQPIELVWRDAQGDVVKTVRQYGYCLGRRGAALRRCLATVPQAPTG